MVSVCAGLHAGFAIIVRPSTARILLQSRATHGARHAEPVTAGHWTWSAAAADLNGKLTVTARSWAAAEGPRDDRCHPAEISENINGMEDPASIGIFKSKTTRVR